MDAWRIIHANLPVQQGHYELAGLAVDRQNADRIAIAAGDQDGRKDGVFLSNDGGKTWKKLDPPPNRWYYNCLAFAGHRLLAESGGNGVFWTDLDNL